jgi:DNA-binding transcriptional regulator YiaG
MMEQLVVALQGDGATSAPVVRQYRASVGGASFPPSPDELARSIIPPQLSAATAPSQGTHALFDLTFMIDGEQQIKIPLININKNAGDDVAYSLPATENVTQIKERLALSMTQVAELFNVTRKSVYDWYGSAAPRPAMAARIQTLLDVLNYASEEVDLKRLKVVWNIPLSGASFRSVLNDDNLEPNRLRSALAEKLHELSPRLIPAAQSMRRASGYVGQAHLADIDRSIERS